MSDDCTDVAGEEIFILANPENERTATTGADHKIRDIGVNDRDSVSADDLLQGRAHGVHEARLGIFPIELPVNAANEMGENFRVCVRVKIVVAVLDQLLLESLVILDHAVMNERDFAAGIEMRMRIFIVHLSVRRPASLTGAGGTSRGFFRS